MIARLIVVVGRQALGMDWTGLEPVLGSWVKKRPSKLREKRDQVDSANAYIVTTENAAPSIIVPRAASIHNRCTTDCRRCSITAAN